MVLPAIVFLKGFERLKSVCLIIVADGIFPTTIRAFRPLSSTKSSLDLTAAGCFSVIIMSFAPRQSFQDPKNGRSLRARPSEKGMQTDLTLAERRFLPRY